MNRPTARTLAPLLDGIFALLPARVIAIRTDYVVSPKPASRRVLQCEYFGSKHHYCLLSTRPNLRETALKTLRCSIGVQETVDAERILDLAAELAEHNDLGAWARPGITCAPSGGSLTPDAPGHTPALIAAYEAVRAGLPGIDRIELAQAYQPGGSSRKSWWQLYTGEAQVVAVAGNAIPGLLRSYFGSEPGGDYAAADRHLGRWAHQAGVSMPGFIDAMASVLMLETLQRPDRIVLEAP